MSKIKALLLCAGASLIAMPAIAADLPKAAPVPVYAPAPAVNWTGFYAGVNIGGAQGHVSTTDLNGGVPPGPFNYNTNGVIGGGQVGFNYQWNNIVAGLEVDLGYMGATGKGFVPSSTPGQHQDLTLSGGLTAGVSGRLGYAYGNFLPYFKGGYVFYDGHAMQQTTKAGYVPTATGSYDGTAIGGGLEYALRPDWSIKVEYLHYDLGSQGGKQTSIGDPPIGFQYLNSTSVSFDTYRIGANYHW